MCMLDCIIMLIQSFLLVYIVINSVRELVKFRKSKSSHFLWNFACSEMLPWNVMFSPWIKTHQWRQIENSVMFGEMTHQFIKFLVNCSPQSTENTRKTKISSKCTFRNSLLSAKLWSISRWFTGGRTGPQTTLYPVIGGSATGTNGTSHDSLTVMSLLPTSSE